MKKLAIFLVFLFALVGCSTKGKTPFDDSKIKPDVFCEVIQKPVPLLMGTWECRFTKASGTSKADKNYVKYQLIKYEDKYGLYFYRTWRSGKKKKTEWKNWTINGQEILGETRFGVKIFVQGRDVYFTIRGLEEPVKMSRVKAARLMAATMLVYRVAHSGHTTYSPQLLGKSQRKKMGKLPVEKSLDKRGGGDRMTEFSREFLMCLSR